METAIAHEDWRVARRPNGEPPIVGRIYEVRHSRKGTFAVKIKAINDEWADCEIVDGTAGAVMNYNVRYTGDEVTIRASMSYFIPVPSTPAVA